MAAIFACALACCSLAGCSLFQHAEAPKPELPRYEPIPGGLENEYFHTPSGDIAGRYPKGWLRVDVGGMEDMDGILTMFTDKERASALILMEIPATPEFRRKLERDGMTALSDESFATKVRRAKLAVAMTRKPEIVTLDSKLLVSYEYAVGPVEDSGRIIPRAGRVFVFTTGAKFYELAMIELTAQTTASKRIENFRLLQSVIASLEGVAVIRKADASAVESTK